MINTEFIQTMARYNKWQNQSLYGACDQLEDIARKRDRGAFFGSIHGTLCHLLWGDRLWMSRFSDSPPPQAASIGASKDMISDWQDLRSHRLETDELILNWAGALSDQDIDGDLTWFSGAAGREVSKPFRFLIAHFFNHQTHHRGQAHAMITAAGGKPDDTDLFFLPQQ